MRVDTFSNNTRVVSRFPLPRLHTLPFFLAILYRVLQSSSVLFDPCYWKLTTSGRTIVCVRVATHVLYVARESTRAWHCHLRREGWHPFVCSSRFLNSIALVVWRTLIRSRWTHSSLYMEERRQWISSSYYRQLKARTESLFVSVCQWDNQAWIQNTVDSLLIHLCIVRFSITIMIEKSRSNSWSCYNYHYRVIRFST